MPVSFFVKPCFDKIKNGFTTARRKTQKHTKNGVMNSLENQLRRLREYFCVLCEPPLTLSKTGSRRTQRKTQSAQRIPCKNQGATTVFRLIVCALKYPIAPPWIFVNGLAGAAVFHHRLPHPPATCTSICIHGSSRHSISTVTSSPVLIFRGSSFSSADASSCMITG